MQSGNACRVARWFTCLALLVVMVTFQPTVSADIPIVEDRIIEWGEYWNDRFDAEEGDTIQVSFDSAPHALDILVFDNDAFYAYLGAFYGNGTVDLSWPGTRLRVTDADYSFRIPQDGTYVFVVDNTHLPDNGASTGLSANFLLSVDSMNYPEPLEWSTGMGWFSLVIIAILVIGLVIGLMLVVLFANRKKKDVVLLPYQVQAEARGLELVTCSKCGNPVPKGAFCAKCGERLQ